MASKLTPSIVQQVFETLSIRDVATSAHAISGGSNDDVEAYIKDRTNPMFYLRKLTHQPELLLAAMCACDVFLSGSRAAEYFCPGLAEASSDWDFFVEDDTDKVVHFLYLMECIGVHWEPSNPSESSKRHPHNNYEIIKVFSGVLTSNSTEGKVQLVCCYASPIEHVLSFHSSIVQCFISGCCAVSMYDKLTSRARSIFWSHIGRNGHENPFGRRAGHEVRAAVCVEKYKLRGVSYLTNPDTGSWEWPSSCYDRMPYEVRRIGDTQTKVVWFEDYYKEPALKDFAKNNSPQFLNVTWKHIQGCMPMLDKDNALLFVGHDRAAFVELMYNMFPNIPTDHKPDTPPHFSIGYH